MSGVLLYCRAGFENDAANEIQHKAAELGYYGFVKTKANSGFVCFECYQADDAQQIVQKLPFTEMVFARQWFAYSAQFDELDTDDRIGPLLAHILTIDDIGDLRVEHADSTLGRELSKFCRKFTVPLRQVLRKHNKLAKTPHRKKPVLHVFFTSTNSAFVGVSFVQNNSPLELGICRLKFPHQAPSRSTLKLEEAIHLFLTKEQQQKRFVPGMHAVDLGACPGGWTYQLVERGLFVQAIDNGMMADSLMETGQVKHYQEDGFKYRPKKKNVHWLVCDMIERPDKVARLMAQWVAEGWCKEAIFNLKLPMKKRFESYLQAKEIIKQVMDKQGVGEFKLQAKHLYHDREEITLHLQLA
ncbi:23S rRNA (cytidine(2498)-2'-O)-methyltransferase RlmM [Alteromonadaceae bacterium BrNp21-10]|nr:23S rRNA (cytidine(2498)-2'-O)-methyltransferase RlmM [Alteromonadaceae bacterium BrNp21-10]